jgi:hypothetical protein
MKWMRLLNYSNLRLEKNVSATSGAMRGEYITT